MSHDKSSKSPTKDAAETTLELESSSIWQCLLCDHLESQSSIRCSQCSYWRVGSWGVEALDINPVSGGEGIDSSLGMSGNAADDESGDTLSGEVSGESGKSAEHTREDNLLNHAFARLQRLFIRAQKEGRTLGDAERAEVYEALLQSLLKIERAEIKRATIKHAFQQEREELQRERDERKRAHMIHLSLIWFLGICVGFVLYAGLQHVSNS